MVAIGVLLFVVSIVVHELGHAFAMRRYGVELDEICLLGVAGPVLLSFYLRKVFGETPLTIRMIPLGAFVRPTEEGAQTAGALPYLKFAHIMGAGIANNF